MDGFAEVCFGAKADVIARGGRTRRSSRTLSRRSYDQEIARGAGAKSNPRSYPSAGAYAKSATEEKKPKKLKKEYR